MACEFVIQYALNETLLAPTAKIILSVFFLIYALYALSAKNVIIILPLLSVAIHSISAVRVLRDFATISLVLAFPKEASTFAFVAGVIWFFTGVLFIIGFRLRRPY